MGDKSKQNHGLPVSIKPIPCQVELNDSSEPMRQLHAQITYPLAGRRSVDQLLQWVADSLMTLWQWESENEAKQGTVAHSMRVQ